MSPIFLLEFKKKNKCPWCADEKLDGYSLCGKCLDVAKKKWLKWSHKRRKEGKCSYCEEPNYEGGVRCWPHVLLNRQKCLAWNRKNKEHIREYDRKTNQAWYALGRCPACAKHDSLMAGKKRCPTCNERQRAKSKAKRMLTKLLLLKALYS